MPLTVLTDSDVRSLLLSLRKEEIEQLQDSLAEALHEYSTDDANSSCCSSYQPQRIVIKRQGVTTLFMPASTGESLGMKIVALEAPEAPEAKREDADSSPLAAAIGGVSISPSTSNTKTSTPSISGASFQQPTSVATSSSTTPQGVLTILDRHGLPVALINAEELTAFRTALAATILFTKRHTVDAITIFGAGKQAFWHLKIALLLRGPDITHINIINRTLSHAMDLITQIQSPNPSSSSSYPHIEFYALSPDFDDYDRLLKDHVQKADVLFCCTPSLSPLFPAEFLISSEGREKGRLISAIGSYAPHMTELHPDILRLAVEADDRDFNHHYHDNRLLGKSDGVVVVDGLEACLREAGEVIQAGLRAEQLVEIGEVVMMSKKAVLRGVEVGDGGGKGEKGLRDWLEVGNVLYKSVGLGLMDLKVGWDLVALARQKGVGTTIQDF